MHARYFQIIRRCARYVVALGTIGSLAIVIGYLIGPEAAWPIAVLQYIPHVFLLIPAIAAAGLSFVLGWRWRIASFAVLAAFVTIVMAPQVNFPSKAEKQLRLMTYNAKSYVAAKGVEGMWPIKFEIDQYDADIIVLQDAGHLSAMLSPASDASHQLFGNREFYMFGQYVVASRHKLRECRPGSISYRGQNHTYVRCVVEVNGTDIDLFTAHFASPREGLAALRYERMGGIEAWKQSIADRLTQGKSLGLDVRASTRPRIVAGDLNAVEQSLAIKSLLNAGLQDAFSLAGNGFGYTYGHALWPGPSFTRIDHILVSSEFGVVNCYAGGDKGSEHRPVIADLTLANRK